MNDLHLALRGLRKNKGFTFAVSGLLTAGIGVTTLTFSAVDAILLRPLPARHPEQVVHLVQDLPRIGLNSQIPLPVYEALRDRTATMSAVFGEREFDLDMTEPAPAERIRVHLPTPNYFEVLGVKPLLGRVLVTDDAKANPGDPPVVLSYSFWQRRFQGNPKALGKSLRILGQTFMIVGVLPREFNGFTSDTAPDVRVPLRTWPVFAPGWRGHPDYLGLDVAGRLQPGISAAKAQAESRVIWQAALDVISTPDAKIQSRMYPLELVSLEYGTSILRDRYAVALKFLIACSAFLLLMVCANVAGLLLARGAVRRQEIAVRLALGATRIRLTRQMLVESSLLAAMGAAGGIALAAALTPVLARLLPTIHDLGSNRLTLSLGLGVDRRVLLFSLILSVATVVLFGLAPAISASRTSLESILRSVRTSRTWHGRQALIVIQVTLCTVLLTGAGLLIQTFEDLRKLNPGFDVGHVVTLTIDPPVLFTPGMPRETFKNITISFFDTLRERIRDTPGVLSVALAAKGVMRDRGFGTTIARAGERPSQADTLSVGANFVTQDYFDTMGIRFLRGHLFTEAFDLPQPEPVVVNEAFVRRFFSDTDPLGKRFGGAIPGRPAPPSMEITGVVTDAKYRSLREPILPIIYHPYQYGDGPVVVHVRARVKPESMIQPLRRAIAAFDPSMPIIEVDTLSDEVDASASAERLSATLGSIFASLATLLSAAGIYGLLAYTVAQRRREIGIRVALGATPANIGELIGRQGLLIVVAGVILGLAVARAVAPLIASLLYGVMPEDPRSLGFAALIVLAMAVLAAAVPAVRAAAINPATALRQDH